MNSRKRSIRIAVLDLNEGHENQGMRCIREIINNWGNENNLDVMLQEFEVRLKHQTPDTNFDIYISSGGPGSPLDSVGSEWENHYFTWLDTIETWNKNKQNLPKNTFSSSVTVFSWPAVTTE